jgi:hypothetical protein
MGVVRGLFVYVVYVVVVSAALLNAVSAIGDRRPPVAEAAPTTYSLVSISLVDGSPEQTVLCSAATNSVGADALVLYSQTDMNNVLRDLGCAPP